MPGRRALAWLREQVGQGLAWGSATLHKGLWRFAGCQEVGGWPGTTPGWDTAPILGVSSHSQAHRGGRAPGQCWAWELSRGHGLKALGWGVEKQTRMAIGAPEPSTWEGEARGRSLDLKHGCVRPLFPRASVLEVSPPLPTTSPMARARIS